MSGRRGIVDMDDHLITLMSRGFSCPCGCNGAGTSLMRCRKNRCVIARCATAGSNMLRVREAHEEKCR